MASALDLIRARDAAPAADAELVGPPEPPPQKTSVLDLVRARDAAPPPEPAPKSGSAGGALIGGMARTEKERAETPEFIRRPEEPTPESPPQPDEPPPLLKRRYDEPAPPGAYGKPTRLERMQF